jgi:hypothetical protein
MARVHQSSIPAVVLVQSLHYYFSNAPAQEQGMPELRSAPKVLYVGIAVDFQKS